jgi:hypothetical protein
LSLYDFHLQLLPTPQAIFLGFQEWGVNPRFRIESPAGND